MSTAVAHLNNMLVSLKFCKPPNKARLRDLEDCHVRIETNQGKSKITTRVLLEGMKKNNDDPFLVNQ